MRQYHAKVAASYRWTEGDVEWSERNTIVYPLICSLAGPRRRHVRRGRVSTAPAYTSCTALQNKATLL